MKAVSYCLLGVFCVSVGIESVIADDDNGQQQQAPVAFEYEAAAPAPAVDADALTQPDQIFEVSDPLTVDEVPPDAPNYGYDYGSSSLDGLFRSDHDFDSFIEPVTNSVFFEDPRSMTRIRFLFLNQMIPEDSILAGGDFQLYALQATVALSDRLTLLANRDGYLTVQSDALPNQQGAADLGTGLKYVIIRDTCNQFLLSGGFLYEWANGSTDVFQGNGDGVWNFFLTTGKAWDRSHFVGTVGWHLPNNGSAETESMFYSTHLDYMLTCKLYALWEYTGIHYLESGRAMPGLMTEGGDLINLGAGAVAGNYFASTAFGMAYKLDNQFTLAAAYEFPVTGREDLMDNRTTFTLSWTY